MNITVSILIRKHVLCIAINSLRIFCSIPGFAAYEILVPYENMQCCSPITSELVKRMKGHRRRPQKYKNNIKLVSY
jgi:hypothetical protein